MDHHLQIEKSGQQDNSDLNAGRTAGWVTLKIFYKVANPIIGSEEEWCAFKSSFS